MFFTAALRCSPGDISPPLSSGYMCCGRVLTAWDTCCCVLTFHCSDMPGWSLSGCREMSITTAMVFFLLLSYSYFYPIIIFLCICLFLYAGHVVNSHDDELCTCEGGALSETRLRRQTQIKACQVNMCLCVYTNAHGCGEPCDDDT